MDQNWTKSGIEVDYIWNKPKTKTRSNLEYNWTKFGLKLDKIWTKTG